MKIEIKYFTSTGNTLWMAKVFKTYLERKGHTVLLSNAESDGMEYEDDTDMMGILYPVWGSNFPTPIEKEILKIKPRNKKMFLIGNCALFTGDTGLYWKSIIEPNLHYDVFYVNHVKLPTNVNVRWFNFLKVLQGEKKTRLFDKAKPKLEKMCEDILEGKRKERGKNPFGILGAKIQRHQAKSEYVFWAKKMTIDPDKCIDCKLCEKLCPINNIQVENNYLVKHGKFNENCICCARCYNLCPTDAYLVGYETRNTTRYRRYKGAYPNTATLILS
ncbi:MAG: EFR1 family ferrodoxin, partial [Clostridia bacterium]|nr:EFR1 family ferrodoxin [Clostridia bacterium]